MDLKKFMEEALSRGEKIKSQVLEDLLDSRLVTPLLKNENFLNTVFALLHAKSGIEKKLEGTLQDFFKWLNIPSHGELENLEHKIRRLEHEIGSLSRKELSQKLKAAARTTTKKPVKKTSRR